MTNKLVLHRGTGGGGGLQHPGPYNTFEAQGHMQKISCLDCHLGGRSELKKNPAGRPLEN